MTHRKRGQMSESVAMGLLLALTGGFLDAYTYVARGRVFANAQTGNIVLLGMNLADRNFSAALSYLIPIVAFVAGVAMAEVIRHHNRWEALHWRQITVLFEIVTLTVCAFLPPTHNWLVTSLVSFVCALQAESFRTIAGSTLATTMCTGNLRTATELLSLGLLRRDRAECRRSRIYYLVILAFLAGAVLGDALTRRFDALASLFCAGFLLLGFFIMFFKEER